MSRNLFLASALFLALSLVGTGAVALGVGGLRVQSALNQPFVGEIDLLDIKPDELDAVKAQIAGQEEFGKVGAERYHYLTKLRFSPQISPRGNTVIRISSREPIREPYMDFLVEVQWPKGRIVREYTVLLDPPATAGRSAPRIEPPVAMDRPARAPSDDPAPAARSRAAPASAPPQRIAERSSGAVPAPTARDRAQATRASAPASGTGFPKYVGPVRSGTGLWRLAARNAPQGASVAQTAMALFRNNQGAFIRGNINRLIAGKTLVIPSAAELFALDPDAASRELQAALRGEAVRRAPIAPPGEPGPAGEDVQSRLRIAGTAPAKGAAKTAAPGTEGMQQELLLVQEASESARQETLELRGRIRELETQLSEIQTLLQLRNAQLARIQDGTPAAAGTGPTQIADASRVAPGATPEVGGAPDGAPGGAPTGTEATGAASPQGPQGGSIAATGEATGQPPAAPESAPGPTLPPDGGALGGITVDASQSGQTPAGQLPAGETQTDGTQAGQTPDSQAQAGQPPAGAPGTGPEGALPQEPIVLVPGQQPLVLPPGQGGVAPPLPTPPEGGGAVATLPGGATKLPPIVIQKAPPPAPKAPAQQPPETVEDSTWHALLLPLAGIAATTALGIGALTWLRSRRRRAEDDSTVDLDSAELLDLPGSAPVSGPMAGSVSRAEAARRARGGAAGRAGVATGAGGASAPAADSSDDFAGVESPSSAFRDFGRVEAETDEPDVISEADIYIAYGRYREAEELLREEMGRAPHRVDLKLKLAEAYVGARNRQALRALVQEMQAAGVDRANPEQWQRLMEMAAAVQSDEGGDPLVGSRAARSAGDPGSERPPPSIEDIVANVDSLDLDSDDVFSLDISDARRPPGEPSLPPSAPKPLRPPSGETRLRPGRPVPAEPPRASEDRLLPLSAQLPPQRPAAGAVPSDRTLVADDEIPLLMDEDAFSRHLGLEGESDDLDLGRPARPVPGSGKDRGGAGGLPAGPAQDYAGGVSDLELTIEDLRAASDVDLESFVDSTQAVAFEEDSTPARGEPASRRPLPPSRPSQPASRPGQPVPLRPVAAESAAIERPSTMPGLFGGQEESPSSDLLSSQWQMDSGLWDETATKLDLARAYIEMGDRDSARGILEEVAGEGTDEQRAEASELLRRVG